MPDDIEVRERELAGRAVRPDLALRIRHFSGTFGCCNRGVRGAMQAD
jgi:hypothetical protein